jgi:hypothetical protein
MTLAPDIAIEIAIYDRKVLFPAAFYETKRAAGRGKT